MADNILKLQFSQYKHPKNYTTNKGYVLCEVLWICASKSTVIKEGMVGFSDKTNTLSGASELHSIAFLREKEQKIKPTHIIIIIYMQFVIFKENKTIIIF